ncbi:unnamed protein product [Fraxinus pennsylvanica]|uniref:Uncharacterized protein n=1 Tax=Fraxinus pennsylvanica TaxID=56036 RepID=A0AAD1YR78_9LAMI|nr:unnamed protein product [Fraxinus pennsylvanica]
MLITSTIIISMVVQQKVQRQQSEWHGWKHRRQSDCLPECFNQKVQVNLKTIMKEDNTFFDTMDFLSPSSFKSYGSDFRISSFSSDENDLYTFDAVGCNEQTIISAGTIFPHMKRQEIARPS